MAQKEVSFTEVKRFNERELRKLQKQTYAEIYQEYNNNFCVPVEHATNPEFADIYEEIIQFCTIIKTADGMDVYVAKIKRHLVCTEPLLYAEMKEADAKDECYKNVTYMGGKVFKKLDFYNWAKEMQTLKRQTEFRVPKMRKGSTLFYMAG